MRPFSNREIYNMIKNSILTLELKPGEKLSENQFAKYYNVSRTPIHDALSQLDAEGLIVRYPQRGTEVSLLDWKYIQDIIFMRKYLDTSIFLELMDRDLSEFKPQIEENLKKQKAIAGQDGTDEVAQQFLGLCNEFHSLFYKALDKERLWECVIITQHDYLRYRVLLYMVKEIRVAASEEHAQLYETLLKGNKEEMVEEMAKHLSSTGEDFPPELEEYKDYFRADE